MLEAGDRAKDFRLETARSNPVSLGEVLSGGRNVLMVFLRHLG